MSLFQFSTNKLALFTDLDFGGIYLVHLVNLINMVLMSKLNSLWLNLIEFIDIWLAFGLSCYWKFDWNGWESFGQQHLDTFLDVKCFDGQIPKVSSLLLHN